MNFIQYKIEFYIYENYHNVRLDFSRLHNVT